MTTTENKEIVAYLSGPRNYAEGVKLYERHGHNRMYKRRFVLEDTEFSRALLVEELRKLAGLTEADFKNLPRKSKQRLPEAAKGPEAAKRRISNVANTEDTLMELADSFGVTVDELCSPEFQDRVLAIEENYQRVDELTDELEQARAKYAEAPEPVRKMIRFREKYAFLNAPDCPDVLKILVNDMFAAYDAFKTAFARLQVLPDETIAEAAIEAEKVVTSYLANREIWDELEHYRITGQILGKAAKFREAEVVEDLAALSDLDLAKKLSSARANQSKQSKAVKEAEAEGRDSTKAAAALERWTATRERIEAEIERRKKK